MLSSSSSSSYSSSSSSSSSSMIIDLLHEVVVAMACRNYGEGRVLVHTDKIDGTGTGHGNNVNEFWRRMLEWTAKKSFLESIRVGLVINCFPTSTTKICSLNMVSVEELSIADLALRNLTDYDCLYVVGLPDSVSSVVTQKIATFVENGGGLIIEKPNRSREDINVLRDIDDVYCFSSERLLTTNAYWTIDGGNHYLFDASAQISFMSTLRQSDFSEDWTILMTNVPNIVTTTTTTAPNELNIFDQNSASDFFVSYLISMQNGIVVLDVSQYGMSSSSSLSSSSSSSS